MSSLLRKKTKEAMTAVLPVVGLVVLLSLTAAPIPSGTMLAFLLGALFLLGGMILFSIGSELAMEPMGAAVGASITKTRRLWVILLLAFLLGTMITISEPDLQVLAEQVRAIPNQVIILAVGIGVGIFLMIALLRMLFSIRLRTLFIIFYGLIFLLAVFVPNEYLAVAFDSGGVTTGPMTVPFIMSFGVGIAAIRRDRHAEDDSFGLVALCSMGPILATMLLSLAYNLSDSSYDVVIASNVQTSEELRVLFLESIPEVMKDIGLSLLPIVVFFAVFNLVRLRMDAHSLGRIARGILYSFVGLTLFLTGAYVGFMPLGNYLGQQLASLPFKWIVIPVGMLIGFFIVRAEPAVYVLMHQVEELTDGAISGRSLQSALCIGVSTSIGLAMLRVLTGLNILWLLLPGYVLALALTFFAPKIFTAIAFDAGGVASGPMTATFLLPFAMGGCAAVGGNMATDAFGVVAMVAMTPLITIQILGIVYRIRERGREQARVAEPDRFASLGNDEIIEL